MSPEERCYWILQESNYERRPEDKLEESVQHFIDAGVGCPWLNPTDKIEERQFETVFKNYFEQFREELIKFSKENPPTFECYKGEKTFDMRGFHCMDDQGFEGQIMGDKTFYRWVYDLEGYDQ